MEFEVQIDEQGFKGTAKIKFPTRKEKLEILSKVQKMGYGKGDIDVKDLTPELIDLLDVMSKTVEDRLVELNITHVESETVITDKAMLNVFTEGQTLDGIFFARIISGVALGKKES